MAAAIRYSGGKFAVQRSALRASSLIAARMLSDGQVRCHGMRERSDVTEPVDINEGPTFEDLYERMWWPMLRLAVGLVDELALAEDVVQDAFAAVYLRWSSIRDPSASPGYIRAAFVNASRSARRRQGVTRKRLASVLDMPTASADHSVLLGEERDLVRRAMSLLPQRQREVLVLRYVAEPSEAEIAPATGLSEGGVRSASSRGLATLRTTLGGQL